MFKTLFEGLCDLLFPRNCISCKHYSPFSIKDEILCPSCQSQIEFNRPPFCVKCSRRLDNSANSLCRECLSGQFHFDHAVGICVYNDLMRKLIYQFKYGGKTSLRNLFPGFLKRFSKTSHLNLHSFDVLVPIPLHSARLRERGFNQAQTLSEELAKSYGLLSSSKNLIRIRPTKNQAVIGKKDRWTNIEGAFKIKKPSEFDGKSVLIIDDLLTTGTTASEAARVLKKAGASRVSVMTLAIVP